MENEMTKNQNSFNYGNSRQPWVLGGILVTVWFGVVLALAASGSLAFLPGALPLITLGAILIPPVLFVLALLTSTRFKAWVLSLDPALLTAMQGWRVLGGGFLFVYAFGHLPGLFAWPAGLGDVAVGIGAPFAAIALARGKLSISSNRFLTVHITGLLDFVVAVGTGIFARNQIPGLVEGVTSSAMGELPLVLVPAFGVPVFIILHLIVLVQVWERRRVSSASLAAVA